MSDEMKGREDVINPAPTRAVCSCAMYEVEIAALKREVESYRQAALFDAINTLPEKDATIARLESELSDALTDLNTARQDNASFGPEFKRLKAEVERWKEASTPSAETKAAYWGEFHIEEDATDEDENLTTRKIAVPWHVVKEIMAAISARAALTQEKTDVRS
jgi:hypothetical protein